MPIPAHIQMSTVAFAALQAKYGVEIIDLTIINQAYLLRGIRVSVNEFFPDRQFVVQYTDGSIEVITI